MPTASGHSRRMTLGVVNGNQKRRDTLDVGGPRSARKSKPNKNRQSMIPRVGRENEMPSSPGAGAHAQQTNRGRRSVAPGADNNDRRKSHLPSAATTSTSSVKVDPRPISDKAYQQDCIKRLLDFLRKNGYDNVTLKSLTRPSGKDFTNIVTFMLRLVDPNFQDGPMKFEDEVAMNFKAMGYPFNISKTALVAAGSPHTWPTLLAALSWLVDTYEVLGIPDDDSEEDIDADAGKPFETLEELEQNTDRAFFRYLSLAYTAFLKGDAELQAELEGKLADRFELDDAIIDKEIDRITELNAEICEKIDLMTKDSEDLTEYRKKREHYATELQQLDDLIQQMDEHIAALKQKLNERTKELESTNQKLEAMNSHVGDLKKVVSDQEFSVADMRKMQNERKGVEEAIERTLALKAKRQEALNANKEKMNSLFENLESIVAEYNSKIEEISDLTVVAEKSIPMKAVLDRSQANQHDQTKLLGIDLRSQVLPTLLKCNEELADSTAHSRWRYQESLDRLKSSKEELAQHVEKSKMLEAQRIKSMEVMANDKKMLDAKLEAQLKEVEAMEAKAASLRDPAELEEHLARYERQVTELEALRITRQKENLAKKKAVNEQIDAALGAVEELEKSWTAKQEEVRQYYEKRMGEIGQIKMPSEEILKRKP